MYNRNLRKPSPNKNVHKFASGKTGRTLVVESCLEFDTCFHLEYSKDVISYREQPTGFYYEFEGKSRPYTPDFEVKYVNSTVLIENKEAKEISVPEFQAQFSAKVRKSKALGKALILVTERQVRLYPILNNLKLLHRYTGISSITTLQREILQVVSKVGLVQLSGLSTQFDVSLGELKANSLALIGRC